MSTEKIISSSSKRSRIPGTYAVGALITTFILLLGSSWVVFQIFQNFQSSFALTPLSEKRSVVLLRSEESMQQYRNYGMDPQAYSQRLQNIAARIQEMGYDVRFIKESELPLLGRNEMLLVLDAVYLSRRSLEQINTFISNGGFMFFNFNYAFNSDEGYVGAGSIEALTSLRYVGDLPKPRTSDEVPFIVNRLLSPLAAQLNPGKRALLSHYDPIPLFDTQEHHPDLFLTNWALNSPHQSPLKTLLPEHAGAGWHGSYGQGNWVYVSFPSYLFTEKGEQEPIFTELLRGVLLYGAHEITVRAYPYLDRHSAVWISQDTEYRFEQLEQFIALSAAQKIPVTAFCIAADALKYPRLMKRANNEPMVEIGSHSYSHQSMTSLSEERLHQEIIRSKEVLTQMSGGAVVTGFRPPREELDAAMHSKLRSGGYTYVLKQLDDTIYPQKRDGLFEIGRLGTDDYHYTVSLEWSESAIFEALRRETRFVTDLDGIFNFGIHTHLMGLEGNIALVKRYMEYLKSDQRYHPLNGDGIVERLRLNEKIELSAKTAVKNHLIYIKNLNDERVFNYTFRLYWPNAKEILDVRSEIMGAQVHYVTNLKERYTDIMVVILAPHAQMTLVAQYQK
ncbi:MAG: polysaccharide deacetylase family protein [Campylobacterales bacterium]|nr:polysaccharide deacetylase family protein [Campylobacterales bacterium]